MKNRFDLVILGGGATAFAALTEAARQGLSTAILNAALPLGGTCVNVGCVPSKHLLAVGKQAVTARRNPFSGLHFKDPRPVVDWKQILAEKDELVSGLRHDNYVAIADYYGTAVFEGRGRFTGGTTIEIFDGRDKGITITGDKALIATGSSPRIIPIPGIDTVPYDTSRSILARDDLPSQVIVIGGGYAALEWTQILHRLGSEVTLLQRSPHLLSKMEGQLGRELERCFSEEGVTVHTQATVEAVGKTSEGVSVKAKINGEDRTLAASDLFIATGVQPNTAGIGLDNIGVQTDEAGAVQVDRYYKTANPHVYAAGDVIGPPMLETVAAKEGNTAVKNAFNNEQKTINYRHVPMVVYTDPEVAAVGITEREYMEQHLTCSCRTVHMKDVPKAKAIKDTRGLVQIVRHHETDAIVGVHMVGPRAADMVGEATLAVKFGLTIDDIIDTVHPFPTFSEAFKMAAQAFVRDISKMSCCVE